MSELTTKEKLKVYIAVNPEAISTVKSAELLQLMIFAEEGERILQAEKEILNKARLMFIAASGLALFNLFLSAFS